MLPDLEHLIHLQHLDTTSEDARRRLDELPARHAALDARAAEAESAVAAAKQRLGEAQAARRELEKEVAVVQGRLSKWKDQLLLVKTNKEYQAMQHEIATAEQEVRAGEDRILDRMEEAETQGRLVREAEATLKKEQAAVLSERAALEREKTQLEAEIARVGVERETLRPKIGNEALRLFDHVARQRRGVAIVEARNGHCSYCHVRLRPQVFNEIRRNDRIVQCDSCFRILYYVQPTGQTAEA